MKPKNTLEQNLERIADALEAISVNLVLKKKEEVTEKAPIMPSGESSASSDEVISDEDMKTALPTPTNHVGMNANQVSKDLPAKGQPVAVPDDRKELKNLLVSLGIQFNVKSNTKTLQGLVKKYNDSLVQGQIDKGKDELIKKLDTISSSTTVVPSIGQENPLATKPLPQGPQAGTTAILPNTQPAPQVQNTQPQTPSIEDVRNALASFMSTHGKDVAASYLQKYNARKVSEVKEEFRQNFINDLKQHGQGMMG